MGCRSKSGETTAKAIPAISSNATSLSQLLTAQPILVQTASCLSRSGNLLKGTTHPCLRTIIAALHLSREKTAIILLVAKFAGVAPRVCRGNSSILQASQRLQVVLIARRGVSKMWSPAEDKDSDRFRIDLAPGFFENPSIPVNVESPQGAVEFPRIGIASWTRDG